MTFLDYAARAQRRVSVDVSAHKTTVLPGGISSPTFLFCLCRWREAASILPEAATAEGRTGDMHRRPSVYALRGIIGAHISARMSRYARLILDIRSRWHHQGAYLRNKSEGEKQSSKSPAEARCVTDREQA